MLFKRNNRKKVGIREKTASFVSQRQDGNSQTFSQRNFTKSTLSTWKRNKTKIEEVYHAGLGNKRMRPEKYEDLNKALMKMSSLKVVNRVIHAMLKNNLAKNNQPSMLILEKKSEVKYAVHICLFVHPPLTPYSGR